MSENFLFKLKDNEIIGLEEYYYTRNFTEADGDWIDYVVLYTNELEVIMKNCKILITIRNTYTPPEYTIVDLAILLNNNASYIKGLNKESFISWLECEVRDDSRNKDIYDINFKVEGV